MSLAFVGIAATLLVLPGLAVVASRWVTPKLWLRAAMTSLVTGVAFLEAGFLLLAVPTVFRAMGLTGLADVCERVAGHLVPGGPMVGWAASAAAMALPFAFASGAYTMNRRHRDLWEAASLHGSRLGFERGYEIYLILDPKPVAVSVPGRPGRVILSTGTRDALGNAEELSAVIGHEVGHLVYRHSGHVVILAGLARALGWLWPVRRGIAAARLGLERTADAAAVASAPRGAATVKRALLKLTQNAPLLLEPGLEFLSPDLVAERVRALEGRSRPSPCGATFTVVTVGSLVALGTGTLGVWIGHAHQLAVVASFCLL